MKRFRIHGTLADGIVRGTVIAALVAVLGFWLYSRGSVGDLRGRSARLATSHSGDSFDLHAWAAGNRTQRGQMLADLARKQKFVGMHRDSIEQVLGPSDCYEVQDGWPCYQVQLGDSLYRFAIVLNDPAKPTHVSSISLRKSP